VGTVNEGNKTGTEKAAYEVRESEVELAMWAVEKGLLEVVQGERIFSVALPGNRLPGRP
jgi:hypothetical protein